MSNFLERLDLSPSAIFNGLISNWGWWAVLALIGVLPGVFSGNYKVIFAGLAVGLVIGIGIAARLTRRTEFYEYDEVSPSIVDAIGHSKEAWAAWQTARRLGLSGVLKRGNAGAKLTRVMLNTPDPSGYLTHLAGSFNKVTPQNLADDINVAIERFRTEGVKEIRVFNGPLLNTVIINPSMKKSWICVTFMSPFLDAGERPSTVVRRNRHRKAYDNLKRAYSDTWHKANVIYKQDTQSAPAPHQEGV